MIDLILIFALERGADDHLERRRQFPDVRAGLNPEDAWEVTPLPDMVREMNRHGFAIVREQDAPLDFAPFQEDGIGGAQRRRPVVSDSPDLDTRSQANDFAAPPLGQVFIEEKPLYHADLCCSRFISAIRRRIFS